MMHLIITFALAHVNPPRIPVLPERIDRDPFDGPRHIRPIWPGVRQTPPQKPVVPFRRFLTVVFARCQVDPGARAAAAGASADAEEHSVQLEP